jgi:ribosomal protein L7Ae-like RNA K-turn-binding protein
MVMGFDVSLNALKDGSSKCILVASDTSPKTVKELNYQIDKHGITGVKVLQMPITMDVVNHSINAYAGIIAICDKGFSKSFEKLIES